MKINLFKNKASYAGIAILVFTFIFIVYSQDDKKNKQKKSSADINWLTYEQAVKLNAKKKKKIFIDVYTDWCGWCKKMDNTTFKDPIITEYMNKKFYAVKLNAESKNLTTYKGYSMTDTELAKRVFKATGYPTTVYLDESENVLSPVPGYLDANTLNMILHFYGEDKYKIMTWEEFQKQYTSQK
ncbi:MAG: DUF255 domain-containing protein [Cytophagaceae bacterium]|nr:DUF255 domain-containing protein [Cytophagaceae bacterium]MDW8456883.1 DUF255 domain-containing protein [Cytophagaceae bacterium]